tara:strand:+ start:269 stop:772 length:504 start_codon:yes stop_codon:yes gene_type:complete
MAYKQKGWSAFTKPGIFDVYGNRISSKRAEEMKKNKEPGYQQITYTEGDALRQAQIEMNKASSASDKAAWANEISEQAKTMSDRMKDPERTFSSDKLTRGEDYTARHNLDKILQEKIEKGTYKEEEEPKGYNEYSGANFLSGHGGVKSYSQFPTKGLINQLKEKLKK